MRKFLCILTATILYSLCYGQVYRDLDSSQIHYLQSIIPNFTARYNIIQKHRSAFQPNTVEAMSSIMYDIEKDTGEYFDDMNYYEALKILGFQYINNGDDASLEELLYHKRKYLAESQSPTFYYCVIDWLYGMLNLRQHKFDNAIGYLERAALAYDSLRLDEYEYILIWQNLALSYLSVSNIDAFEIATQNVVRMTSLANSSDDNFPQELMLFTKRLQALYRIMIDEEIDEGTSQLEALAFDENLPNGFRIAVLIDLADIYLVTDKPDEFLRVNKKCLELTNSDDYKIFILDKIWATEWNSGRDEDIISHLVEHSDLVKEKSIKEFTTLTSTYRKAEWVKNMEILWKDLHALHRFPTDSNVCALSYNNLLFIKNKNFASDKILRDYVVKSGTETQKKLLDYINRLYEHVTYKGVEETDDAASYAWELSYAESDLMNGVPIESLVRKNIMTWKDVQNMLDYDEVAIELTEVCVPFPIDSISSKLCALLITKESKFPKCIELGNYYTIMDELRELFSKDPALINEVYSKRENAIYKMLWENLVKEIKDFKTVYFSTNTFLSFVNIGALLQKDGSAIASHWNLHILSSTDKINEIKRNRLNTYSTTLFGGGDFSTNNKDLASADNLRDAICRAINERGNFTELKGAVDEVNTIDNMLKESKIKSTCLTKDNAVEENFRELDGHPTEIIHIATHFFHINDSMTLYSNEFLHNLMAVDNTEPAMVTTGFILSTANSTWNGKEKKQFENDGIILSSDIARMDLSGCDLLVMSGCQSGEGQIRTDGLIGLFSAFKAAGVKTIMQSLWNVDDSITKEFMIEYYKSLIAGRDKYKAYFDAQSIIRGKYPAPYYWAAFVMLD